jgi:hypothetical protein
MAHPSPDPDKEISTIRLFRLDVSWSGPQVSVDLDLGQRKILEDSLESLPGHSRSLAPTPQPPKPGAFRFIQEHRQTSMVAVYSEIIEMPLQANLERCILLRNRQMTIAFAP